MNCEDVQLKSAHNCKSVVLKLYLSWNVRGGLGFNHIRYSFAYQHTESGCETHRWFLKESHFPCLPRLSGRLFFNPSFNV